MGVAPSPIDCSPQSQSCARRHDLVVYCRLAVHLPLAPPVWATPSGPIFASTSTHGLCCSVLLVAEPSIHPVPYPALYLNDYPVGHSRASYASPLPTRPCWRPCASAPTGLSPGRQLWVSIVDAAYAPSCRTISARSTLSSQHHFPREPPGCRRELGIARGEGFLPARLLQLSKTDRCILPCTTGPGTIQCHGNLQTPRSAGRPLHYKPAMVAPRCP